jgi:1-acyl-sn-glycerol-3-phosphate acyltransferase
MRSFSPRMERVRDVNSSVDQIENGQPEAGQLNTESGKDSRDIGGRIVAASAPGAPARLSPHAIPGRTYGWLSRLRSYLIFDPLIWFYTLAMGIVALPGGMFDRSGRRLHWFSYAWSWLIMNSIFSPVKVTGFDKVDTSKPHVYAVNHASAIDIPVIYVNLPFQFRIAFKKELLAYPVVGWQLRRSGQICIDQQNPSRSIGSIRAALKGLKDGLPLVIFPEGGRTSDGDIKPFLPGAFFLAIKAQVDIVPVALVGTYELLPMDTYHIKCRPLEMRVGEPIPTAGLTMRDLETLSARVQSALEALYYATGPQSN